ncbi:hypothetical protein HHK36_020623 [Tetracentron sinense]|uniref:Ribosome-recycling factor, chloroplastic n=1 Tax=Tetracentron sinense TaxID=13715 RepID=A0A834YUC0_TETSI|nr:hypothetical protein HHK36_020623 [Tetracentron sinense]
MPFHLYERAFMEIGCKLCKISGRCQEIFWQNRCCKAIGSKEASQLPSILITEITGVFRCATIEEIEAEKSLIEKDVKGRMEKTIETVRANFNAVRTGRANPAMLDGVEVEYYGSPVSLKSIAQISTPDASSLLVQPYDKSSLKAIEKAIVSSDLGLTPNNDGEVIRLSIPQLTSDRRKEFLKVVAKQAEEGKDIEQQETGLVAVAISYAFDGVEVALRNIRRDAIKAYEKLEKEKKLSEDNVKGLSSDLQKVTDEYMKKIESIYKQKEKATRFCPPDSVGCAKASGASIHPFSRSAESSPVKSSLVETPVIAVGDVEGCSVQSPFGSLGVGVEGLQLAASAGVAESLTLH